MVTGGAFSGGPWSGLMALPWPPEPEPSEVWGGVTAAEPDAERDNVEEEEAEVVPDGDGAVAEPATPTFNEEADTLARQFLRSLGVAPGERFEELARYQAAVCRNWPTPDCGLSSAVPECPSSTWWQEFGVRSWKGSSGCPKEHMFPPVLPDYLKV